MRAAFGGGHGVAVGLDKSVTGGRPVDRPFDGTGDVEFFGKAHLSGKGLVGIGGGFLQGVGQVIGEAPGKVEHRLHRRVAIGDGRFPADFDARKEIGLGPRHFQKAMGFEGERAENLGVRVKGNSGAAAVRGGTHLAHGALRDAAAEFLHIKLAVQRDLDPHHIRQGVDHGRPHAMQASARGIGVAAELAARVKGAQDHLQRGFAGEFGVRIDGDAAPVVADGDGIAFVQFHLDPGRMARHGLVHGVVEDFGHKVM